MENLVITKKERLMMAAALLPKVTLHDAFWNNDEEVAKQALYRVDGLVREAGFTVEGMTEPAAHKMD